MVMHGQAKLRLGLAGIDFYRSLISSSVELDCMSCSASLASISDECNMGINNDRSHRTSIGIINKHLTKS